MVIVKRFHILEERLLIIQSRHFLTLLFKALEEKHDWDICELSNVRMDHPLTSPSQDSLNYSTVYYFAYADHQNWAIDWSDGLNQYINGLQERLRRYLKSRK